jgi:hypothetical protein
MLQIKDYRRDVNDVGLAGPPTENSWFRHWSDHLFMRFFKLNKQGMFEGCVFA